MDKQTDGQVLVRVRVSLPLTVNPKRFDIKFQRMKWINRTIIELINRYLTYCCCRIALVHDLRCDSTEVACDRVISLLMWRWEIRDERQLQNSSSSSSSSSSLNRFPGDWITDFRGVCASQFEFVFIVGIDGFSSRFFRLVGRCGSIIISVVIPDSWRLCGAFHWAYRAAEIISILEDARLDIFGVVSVSSSPSSPFSPSIYSK